MTTNISIVDHMLPHDTHNSYDVNFFGTTIPTLVTIDSATAAAWLSQSTTTTPSVIGLDIEWRPNRTRSSDNAAATLQLCAPGPRCLIFQLLHSDQIPPSLPDFLHNPNNTFVGIGIESDLEKLTEDYGFGLRARAVDLRELAAEVYGDKGLKNAGLKEMARVVLDKEVVKPKRVTMSRWDNPWLTPEQVQYACVDAYVSYEVGRVLNANGSSGS